MKTKISHLGRSAVSVILAVMMLLSTMLIGTISVNAADFFTVGDTLYLDISGANYDATADNAGFYIKFYKQGTSSFSWSKLSQIGNSKVYSGTVPTGEWDRAVFARVNSQTFDSTKNWIANTVYSSATTTISDKGNDNCWSLNNEKMNGTWTTYSGGSGGGSTEATFNGGDTYYLQPSSDFWGKENAKFKITLSQGVNGSAETTIDMNKVSDSPSTYSATLPKGSWNVLTFKRMDSEGNSLRDSATTSDPGVGTPTNGQNCFTETDWNNKGTWSTYSATAHVAESVSLTASSETVKVGDSVTLTAVVTNPVSTNLTYEFAKTIGGDATVTQNNDKLTVTPSAAGTYKYKVTVSANGFSPVTSTEASFTVTDSVKYYICGRFNTTWHDPSVNDPQFVEDESKPGLFYYETGETIAQLSGTIDETYNGTTSSYPRYFYVNRAATKNSNYLTTSDRAGHNFQSNTVDSKLALIGQSGTEEKRLVRFNDVNNTSTTPVTIWLDTRNNEYKLWYTTALPHNVKVAEGVSASVDKETATAGETVTVTATPGTGEVLQSVTVVDADNTPVTTTVSGNTATFVMPDQDVTVTNVIFRDVETYTVEFSSSDDNSGTVSAKYKGDDFTSGKTVTEGDTVTIKATPIGSNIFKSWSIDGDYDIKDSKTTSDAEITIVVKSNITATASFTETSPYQVAYGSKGTLMRMNKTKYDGVYISTGTIVPSPDNDKNPASHFTIYDTANNQYASISAKGYYWLKDENPSITMGDNDSWINNYTDGSDKGLINNACKSDMYVVYNANTKTITLTGDPDYGTKATLYVKNGTYSTSFTTGATKDYAGSSVAAGLATTKTDPCNTYSVDLDTNVNIQTTLNDTYRKAGYYVAAYSVNGRNYPASAKNADQGIYQANITITEDLAENCVVEVTPIYYNRTIEKDDNYITFYVDAERLVGGWGSTVAIYAYAYEGGTANYGSDGKPTNNVNLLGAYPGQPMVKDGQYYVAKIPRYNYKISSDGSLEIDKTSPVAGITLNNYYNETVHKSLVPIKRNMQTYDFSDFVVLANKKDVKTIMFQSKFYNATGAANRNTSVVFDTAGVITNLNPKLSIPNIGDAATINVNPYEDFTDYYGRATDAIGNLLNDDQKTDNDNLYIISTGSYNNQSPEYSTKGEWVTIWNVYDHNGNLITYGTPADFLNENTTQYKAIAEKYKGKPVKISYEKGLSYDNGVTSRTDGRWYYSTLGQEFTSDVAIEYKDKDDTYKLDTNTNTDNTGFIGQTSGATATINNVTTASFTSVTDNARLSINVANGWRFDGWFIKQGDKYTEVSDNYTDISTDVLMSNSYHIVARVSEIPTGTLELNHTAYTGTDPAAHTGTGFYYISAVLYDQTGAVKHSYAETQGKISIDDFAATDSLEITLKAKCHGDNTVYALYKGEAGGYTKIGDKDYEGDPSFSYTFKVSANSLFEGNELAVNALNYYTDIVKVGGTCDITYMYKDRFGVEGEGKMVSYVVRNVELSSEEIQDNYQPSDSTITKYAPRIDTMYLETKWNLTDTEKVKKGRSQATVTATQTDKTCDVYYPNKDGEHYTDSMNIKTVAYNTLFKDDNGNFILSAPEIDENGKQFSYWDVYKADKNGGITGELVTKCYERNFGLRIMADYYIVPVYSQNVPDLTANINSPVLNREIYGDSANPTDKLYVDLLTAFTSSDIPTFKENTTNLSVECGVFVVRNNTKTLSETDRNTLVQEALDKNSVDTTSTILETYKRTSKTEESVVNKLEALAVDSNVKDKSNTLDTFDNEQYRITKFIFDNDTLTNKNRIDEVLKYTNNTANQNYIFSAYAFVVIKDSHGIVQKKKISDPQYFNLCYVGNKALDNN